MVRPLHGTSSASPTGMPPARTSSDDSPGSVDSSASRSGSSPAPCSVTPEQPHVGIRVSVLAGGYGGAKLSHGLALASAAREARQEPPLDLSIIVNTGDDLTAPRAGGVARPRHDAVHARRPRQRRDRLGRAGRDLERLGDAGAAGRRDLVPPRRPRPRHQPAAHRAAAHGAAPDRGDRRARERARHPGATAAHDRRPGAHRAAHGGRAGWSSRSTSCIGITPTG